MPVPRGLSRVRLYRSVPMSSTTAAPIANMEEVLANMELRALRVSIPDERARIFNLAGDLCFDAGSRERSLSYYGRAIDIYIAAQSFEAAVNMCRKIVRLTPEVVRARCTLAWMALGRGLMHEARLRIADYADAASAAGKEGAAAHHLRLMTEVAENQEVLESLAEALLQVGDDAGANRAYGAALGRNPTRRMRLPDSPEERWAAVLELLGGYDQADVLGPAAAGTTQPDRATATVVDAGQAALAQALAAALEHQRSDRSDGSAGAVSAAGAFGNHAVPRFSLVLDGESDEPANDGHDADDAPDAPAEPARTLPASHPLPQRRRRTSA